MCYHCRQLGGAIWGIPDQDCFACEAFSPGFTTAGSKAMKQIRKVRKSWIGSWIGRATVLGGLLYLEETSLELYPNLGDGMR